MINVNIQQYGAFVREKITRAQDVQMATSIILGIAVSRLLAVPAGTLDSLETHYNNTVVYDADGHISRFNESLVVDPQLAAQVCRGFWKMRALAYASSADAILFPKGPENFFEKIFGASSFLPQNVTEFLNKNSEVMIVLLNRIQPLLAA
jgi:hypothetical protein